MAFLLSVALLFSCAAWLLPACTDQTPEQEEQGEQGEQGEQAQLLAFIENGATEYTIIRRELDPDRVITDACVLLRTELIRATGAQIQLRDDFVARGESIPTDAPEILVGDTTRQESIDALATLGENEYVIKVVGSRLVIIGQNDQATVAAVQAFLHDVLGYNADTDSYSAANLLLAVDFEQRGVYDAGVEQDPLNIFNLSDEMYDVLSNLDYTTPDASAVDAYQIASDGGLIYNPISREKADQLSKYDSAACYTGSIKTTAGNVEYTLTYKIPKNVTAYDAVPIWYEVTSSENSGKIVYIEATAFEESDRTDEDYYALTLPGKVDVTWEYLGYVGGTDNLVNRPMVTASDRTNRESNQYPQYNTTELIYSGDIKSHNQLWWKFRYTNTGNTILEGDGNGTFCFEPFLFVKQKHGGWEQYAAMGNMYARLNDTLYPGESGEVYFTFDRFDMPAGEYKIVINSLVRNETSNPENYWKNIWGGEIYSQSEFTFTVSADGSDTEPNDFKKIFSLRTPTRNKWLHRYEEFMTSFDTLLKGVTDNKVSDVMYLQCAPFTEQVTLRLMIGNEDNMVSIAIPVNVETDSLKINFNPDNNNYVVLQDGTRFPAITAQSMADMRGNVQLGPDAAYNVLDNLMDMKDIGINVINTTAAFEYDGSFGTTRWEAADACWFSLDAARLLCLRVEGWIGYPYVGDGALDQANSLFRTKLTETGYGSSDLALAHALNTIWQYLCWGDNYWLGGDDVVVVDVEDTRGWMRVDYNARSTMSETSKNNFRLFLMDLYGDIDSLNDDWDTEYESFEEIDPEVGTTDDHGWCSYKNENAAFMEWGRPLEVLDMFRTLERIEDYEMVLSELQKTLPTALINMRTEGANWLASVDPNTDNSHLRHVYYSQRRCAIIPELISEAGVLYAASDYTTLPYTPSEVAELTAASVESGIIPMLLPQFNRMRDIAINSTYGNDFTYDYNLVGATKGAYINTVCSVYEWFEATYENGGVPGILWQDYLCDGYATETQRKEIAFFTEKLTEALQMPEGQAWAKNFDQDTSVLADSDGAWSYDSAMVQALIDRVAAER